MKILQDEPDVTSDLFFFNKIAKALTKYVISDSLPTPFTIAVNGSWGTGKTSLLQRVINSIKADDVNKIVWFDAWEYERFDPASSLMHKISTVFPNKNNEYKSRLRKFSPVLKFANNLPQLLGLAVGVPLPSLNLELDKIVDNFDSDNTKSLPNITIELQNMIGNHRLIVFIDNLDRCSIENSLSVLETIKLFLQSKNIVFIIAIDRRMVERAWELRYGITDQIDLRAKEHVDKIFQLQLNLPDKHSVDMKEFIETHAPYLCPDEFKILLSSLNQNPRKIKNVLNTLNFLVSCIDDKSEDLFDKIFQAAFIWSIVSTTYPELAKSLHPSTGSDIIKLAFISHFLGSHNTLKMKISDFNNISYNGKHHFPGGYYLEGGTNYKQEVTNNYEQLVFTPSIIEGLNHLKNDSSAFYFFAVLGQTILFNPDKMQGSGESEPINHHMSESMSIEKIKEIDNKNLTGLFRKSYKLSEYINDMIYLSR